MSRFFPIGPQISKDPGKFAASKNDKYLRWTGSTASLAKTMHLKDSSKKEDYQRKLVVVKQYSAQKEEELSLQVGDVIEVVEDFSHLKKNTPWWIGRKENQLGVFPVTYTKHTEEGIILYDFLPPETSNQKEKMIQKAQQGDYVLVIDKQNESWWKVCHYHQIGYMPARYICLKSKKKIKMEAVYDFNGGSGLLSFKKGDTIIVFSQDTLWWSGKVEGDDKVGRFPSNFVKFKGSTRSRRTIRRSYLCGEATKEFIKTEQDYLHDLEILVKHFAKPLSDKLSKKASQDIFSNVDQLLELTREFYKEIKATSNIGEVFLDMADRFKIYTEYCSNHDNAIKTIEQCKSSSTFLAITKKAENHSDTKVMEITSYLIKPVQRICKYPLLLKQILKYTPNTHAQYESLVEALDKMEQVVNYINESKRLQDNRQKLIETADQIGELPEFFSLVKNTRTLIYSMDVYLSKAEGMDIEIQADCLHHIFLFNDLIMIAQLPKKGSMHKFSYVNRIAMDKLNITEKNSIEFEITADRKKIILLAKDSREKEKFVENCKKASQQYFIEYQDYCEAEAQRYFQKFEYVDMRSSSNQQLHAVEDSGDFQALSSIVPKKSQEGNKKGTRGGKQKIENFFGEEFSFADIHHSKQHTSNSEYLSPDIQVLDAESDEDSIDNSLPTTRRGSFITRVFKNLSRKRNYSVQEAYH